jgi:hypothetical protein
MSKRIAAVLVPIGLIAVAIAALPLAQAGTTRNHAVNATVKSKDVETRGQVTIDAGLVTDRRLGEGAALLRTRPIEQTPRAALTFKVFYPSGFQRGEGTLTLGGVQPDGTVTFTGNARFTGGTGRFQGISGRLEVEGTVAPDGLVTATVRGNARY